MLVRYFAASLLCLLALGFSLTGQAQEIPVKDLAVLVDPEGSQTINSVSQLPPARFTPLKHGLTAGYTRSVHWLRFTLQAPEAGEYWLEMQPPFVDSLHLFEPLGPARNAAPSFNERRYGDILPFAAREMPYRAFMARVKLPDSAPHTYYLRLKTSSSSILFLSLWRPADFEQAKAQEYAVLGLYFGLILTLLGINLLYWFWMRDSLHGYFSLFLLGQLFLYLGVDGFVAQFFLPDQPDICDYWVGFFVFFTFAASGPLYRHLLHVEPQQRWAFAVFRVQLILPLLLMPAMFFGYFTEAARILVGTLLFFGPFGLFLAFKRWRLHEPGSFFVFLGFLISIVGMMFLSLAMLGMHVGIEMSDLWQLHNRQITILGNVLAMHMAVATRYRDLKERHREAVLLATQAEIRGQQDRQAQKENQQFMAMLTHELRTPLAVIDGAVQSLQYIQQPEDDETRLRHQRIRRSVRRINGLIKQFLAKDRIENDRLTLQPVLLNSSELAQQVIASSIEGGAERVCLVATESFNFRGDAALMQVALGNLLDNALKYSPRDSQVELRVDRSHEAEGSRLAWTVSDRGAGIAAEHWEEIFGKYIRGSSHGHIAGTGLGLYLVRRIAELHGGSVQIVEREGWGGVLRLCLPLGQSAA